nr:DUF3874 domain-containing protein [Bacteroidales bacterium]
THGALIDNTQPIDYEQLYAQVVEEVCEKEMCYWFKPEETQQIMLDNMPFQQVVDVDAMVTTCFRKPTPNDPGREYTSDEIVEMMMMRYPYLKCTMSLKMRLGATLKRKGFLQRRHNKGNSYVLVPKRIGTTDIGRVG